MHFADTPSRKSPSRLWSEISFVTRTIGTEGCAFVLLTSVIPGSGISELDWEAEVWGWWQKSHNGSGRVPFVD